MGTARGDLMDGGGHRSLINAAALPSLLYPAGLLLFIAILVFLARRYPHRFTFSWPLFAAAVIFVVAVNLISSEIYGSDSRPFLYWTGHGVGFGIMLGILGGLSPSRVWRHRVIPIGCVLGLIRFALNWSRLIAPRLPSSASFIGSYLAAEILGTLFTIAAVVGVIMALQHWWTARAGMPG
jgi:hypothetical protein